MKTKIVPNEARKTVTIILSPVDFRFTDYLYDKFEDKRYFATGTLKNAKYKEDIIPFLKELLPHLNEMAKDKLPKGEKFALTDLITLEEDEYALISKDLDRDGKWDGEFQISLSSKKRKEGGFLFEDIRDPKPVPKEDGWKHLYAVEVELSPGYNEDRMERYVFAVFHRGISIGRKKNDNFKANDDAWGGFDFENADEGLAEEDSEDSKDTNEKEDELEEDGLPDDVFEDAPNYK